MVRRLVMVLLLRRCGRMTWGTSVVDEFVQVESEDVEVRKESVRVVNSIMSVFSSFASIPEGMICEDLSSWRKASECCRKSSPRSSLRTDFELFL